MKIPLRIEQLAYKTIGDETIILDTKVGREVHQLNEVASFIWNLCDGTHDIQSIAEEVCAEYDVDFQVALLDINEIVQELSAKKLLVDKSL